MSIFKINPTDFQSITVVTNPSRYYSSGSAGITGSVHVFARRSKIEKSIDEVNDSSTEFDESKLFNTWTAIRAEAKKPTITNIISSFTNDSGFLKQINNQATSVKKQKTLEIGRFTPSYNFTTKTLKKLAIKDNLSHYYRTTYPSAHWAYSNYHSLNFFSQSAGPNSSVLLYPNDDDGTIHTGYANGRYALSGAFSFDFYINPRYKKLDETGHFKAGTIFHLSSSYALSLITGSQKDANGLPSTFRLQLQLSHSADISPSSAKHGNYPNNLIFLSNDNSLKLNNWHHVVIRWGTNLINHGTGSFNIDGLDKGIFVIPSGTVAPLAYLDNATTPSNPSVLCIGNYYEGRNIGNDRLINFFSASIAKSEGVHELISTVPSPVNAPSPSYLFNHQLQSEIHDLSIKRFYMADADIAVSSSTGLSNTDNVSFYLPPFFTTGSPIRNAVLQTPSIKAVGMTTTPFNVNMAFGVGGHYINTENFLKDFASNHHPRQLLLSATLVALNSNLGKTANEILYEQPAVRKRNLLILPCDDGNFYPNYDIIQTSNMAVLNVRAPLFNIGVGYLNCYQSFNKPFFNTSYIDDLGNYSSGFITLNNMITESPVLPNVSGNTEEDRDKAENKYINDNIGFNPTNPTAPAVNLFNTYIEELSTYYSVSPDILFPYQHTVPLAISYKTRDNSSNQIVFFDISNLYYGIKILPGSFMITDSAISGSGGAISITIKDNGEGTLYRSNSLTPQCKWNSVGTIFYNEGIIAIKSPHLYFFGENQYEMSFKGEQNLHVLRLDVSAPPNYLNSSSNPAYTVLPSTNNANEPDKKFVYVSGINFHDDNLNVVMKTQLAQPIMKRNSEKLLFKIKYDF